MATIPQISQAMRWILGPVADQLGWATGFNQRSNGKMSGGRFAQSLVFSNLEGSDLSYGKLRQSALDAGVQISRQGLEQRFSPFSVELMRRLLEAAVDQVIAGQPSAIPLLQRFSGLMIRDSSSIRLPDVLQRVWPGVGGSKGATAALKLQVRLDYRTGQLAGPVLCAGREHDSHSPYQNEALPKGAIRMADLGYFQLRQFRQDQRWGVYWFSRLKKGTGLYDQQDQEIDLFAWLRGQTATRFERTIYLGKRMRIPCRLLVERVPQAVAEQRRRKLLENYGRKKQVTVSAETLALAEWTLIVTNIPRQLLSIDEALVLLQVRWQIELLFRLWKSLFRIDEWRSQQPDRILTELYAKLLSVVILHWTFLVELWQYPQRSLWQAALVVRHFAPLLALAFQDLFALQQVLALIQVYFRTLCSLNPRRASPATFQLLLSPPCISLA